MGSEASGWHAFNRGRESTVFLKCIGRDVRAWGALKFRVLRHMSIAIPMSDLLYTMLNLGRHAHVHIVIHMYICTYICIYRHMHRYTHMHIHIIICKSAHVTVSTYKHIRIKTLQAFKP